MAKTTIGIIGYGRFGRLLANVLSADHDVYFYDDDERCALLANYRSLHEVLACSSVFFCVPIHCFESVLRSVSLTIKADTVFDVCSVKILPEKWMLEHLPSTINVISTHPLFGPDSYDCDSPKVIMMHPSRCQAVVFERWVSYFSSLSWHIEQITPEEHDRQCAYSQGVTHFIGRVLGQMNLSHGVIATHGYAQLFNLVEQTCNDSLDLFHDMMNFNPYTKKMMKEVYDSLAQVSDVLTKKRDGLDKENIDGE